MIYSGFLALSRRCGPALLLGALAAALPGIASSQLAPGEEPPGEPEVRSYTVEIIVFEYPESAVTGDEDFRPDEPPVVEERSTMRPPSFGDPGSYVDPDAPDATGDADFSTDDTPDFLLPDEPEPEQVLEELPNHILHTRLEVLDPEEYAMKDIYRKLAGLGAYKILMRAAWTQATYEKDQTLPIRLRRLGNAPLRLDGNLTLYMSRFLHFVVDLTLESKHERSVPGRRNDDSAGYFGDRRSSRNYGYGYDQEPTPIKYSISEDRIFRNGELRYYDHPRFGVLARITRVEEEEPETDEMFLLPAEP